MPGSGAQGQRLQLWVGGSLVFHELPLLASASASGAEIQLGAPIGPFQRRCSNKPAPSGNNQSRITTISVKVEKQ